MEKFQYYMLNGSVKVPKELDGYIYNSENKLIYQINNLSKLNFLVGPNNSGKSYLSRELLKSLYNIKGVTYISEKLHEEFNNLVNKFISLFDKFVLEKYDFEKENINYQNVVLSSSNALDSNLVTVDLYEFVESSERMLSTFDFYTIVSSVLRFLIGQRIYLNMQLEKKDLIVFDKLSNDLVAQSQLATVLSSYLTELKELSFVGEFNLFIDEFGRFKYLEPNLIFVSHFRYASNLVTSSDQIEIRLKSLFEFAENSNLQIINGFNLPFKFKELQIAGPKQYMRIEEFQDFLSTHFFNNRKVIVKFNQNAVVGGQKINEIEVQIGNNEVKSFYQLGTGIQMLIILTWPLFEHESGVIFIEEPELYLHPGMQRKLMEIYATHPKSKNFQFFISTHSNHIIDYAQFNPILTSVYRINKRKEELNEGKNPTFVLENVSSNEINLLADLGVSNSSVFLANCTIWAEGITDIMYIRTYMKYYLEAKKEEMEYLENLHFAFVEYGGNLIAHWDFTDDTNDIEDNIKAKVISNRIFLVADRDEVDQKLERKKRLKTELKDNFYLLNVREIENTLPAFVVEDLFIYNELDSITVNEDDYASEKFREFLDEKLPSEQKKFEKMKKTSLALDCIRIIDRKALDLGKITSDNLNQILSPSAIELCEKIYKFIEYSNQN